MRLLIPLLLLSSTACRTDKSLNINNAVPVAEIKSHADDDEVLEGALTTFWGHVSDSNHSASQLQVTWYAGTEVLCETAAPDELGDTFCEAVLDPDDTEVFVLEDQICTLQDPDDDQHFDEEHVYYVLAAWTDARGGRTAAACPGQLRPAPAHCNH